MSFTVLGAGGFIGSRLVAALERDGVPVRAPARGEELAESRHGHIVYCIGLTADFRQRPFDTARAHVGLLADVLERSRFESFTYLSSTRVYLGANSGSEDAELRVDPQRPDDLYNLTKLAGEALCLTTDLWNVRVARLSNVYGMNMSSPSFLTQLIEGASRQGELDIDDHPDSEKDYVHADDVVLLLRKIATSGRERLYNVASGANVSNHRIVELLERETSWHINLNRRATPRSFPQIDVSRVREEFGFQARPLLDGLESLVRRSPARAGED
jgi:nucleoside-diphosphate-sugar epimerase